MEPKLPLATAFAQSRRSPGSRSAPEPGDLEPILAAVVRRAEERWPGIRVDAAAFVRHLAERLPEDTADIEAIEAIKAAATDDLYLAFGCLAGDKGALLAFEQAYLRDVGAFVASIDRSAAFADEVRQALRDKLFAADVGQPKIAEYAGSGALGGWVRVAAMRIALNLRRGAQRAATAGRASVEGALTETLSPELAYLKERYREAFAEALAAAVNELSDRDRALLRLYHVDSLQLEAMAALYRVHLSTVSRWLTRAREQVAEATTRHLQGRLGVGASDVNSIAALVLSQIDVSLTRLLGGSR
jgi:RNA polymerase sigma-70 factor (ECF subfamily)